VNADYPYLDGYVFLHSKASWLKVCQMWAGDPDDEDLAVVRVACKLDNVGHDPDRIVVFTSVRKSQKDAEARLDEKIRKVKEAANPSSSTATSLAVTINGPTRWSEKKEWAAFLRINTPNGRAVFDALDPDRPGAPVGRENFYGLALCEGDWQVFLEIGADTSAGLDPLIERVRALPNVDVIVSKKKGHKNKPPKPKLGECKPWDDGD